MIKKFLVTYFIINLLFSGAYASDKSIGNVVNDKEYPTSDLVLPKATDKADFIIEGSVEKNIDMTLERCLELALGNNPRINSAFHDILVSDARIKQVWSNYFPHQGEAMYLVSVAQQQLRQLCRPPVSAHHSKSHISSPPAHTILLDKAEFLW